MTGCQKDQINENVEARQETVKKDLDQKVNVNMKVVENVKAKASAKVVEVKQSFFVKLVKTFIHLPASKLSV